jgi:hypothetical protein
LDWISREENSAWQAKITEASVAEQVYILCFYESDIELSKDYTKSDQKKLITLIYENHLLKR